MIRTLRALLTLAWWLMILAMLAVAGAAALIATENGTRWLIAQSERLAPFELAVASSEGTLFRGLTLNGFSLALEDTRLDARRAEIWIDAPALLRLTLRVRSVAIEGLAVDLPSGGAEAREPGAPIALPESIEWPVRLVIEQFTLADLRIAEAGREILAIDRLAFRFDAGAQGLRLSGLELAMPDLEAQLDAELKPAGAYPLRVDASWRWVLPDALSEALEADYAQGWLEADGGLRERLHLRHRLAAGFDLSTTVTAEEILQSPRLDLRSEWSPWRYRIDAERAIAIGTGSLFLHGTQQQWTAGLTGTAGFDGLPETRIEASLGGTSSQVQVDSLRFASSAGRIDAAGRIDFDEAIIWQVEAGVVELSTALLGFDPDIMIRHLDLASSGRLPRTGDAVAPGLLPPGLEAVAEIRGLDASALDQRISGSGRVAVREARAALEDVQFRLGESGTVRVGGAAGLGERVPFHTELVADSVNLAFLTEGRELALDRLHARVEGEFDPGSGKLNANIALRELAGRVDGQELSATGEADVSETLATIHSMELRLPAEGALSASGEIGFADGLSWDLALSGRSLNPGLALPDLPGNLSLELVTRGTQPSVGDPRAELELSKLHGQLRGLPVGGAGSARWTPNRLDIDGLALDIAANRLRAQGWIDESLDLHLSLAAPELDAVLPGLGGRIDLDAQLGGTRDRPRVMASGQGAELRYADYGIGDFLLDIDAGLDPEAPAELSLRLAGIDLAGQRVDSLQIGAEGTASAHRLALEMSDSVHGRVNLLADGGYDPDAGSWSGLLRRLDLDQPLAGSWSLERPAAVRAGPDAATLDELCIERAPAGLCLSGRWHRERGAEGRGELRDLPLAWFEPWLAPDSRVDGALSARFEGVLDASGRVRASVEVPPTAGALQAELGAAAPAVIPFADLHLLVQVAGDSADVSAGVSFLDDGEARVSLRVQPERDTHRLDGEIRARVDNLEWLGTLTPEVRNVRGRLRADLELGGLLSAPLVRGGLRVEEAGAAIPEAGLELELPLLLAEVISVEEMRLSGEIRSGGESLNLQGTLGFGSDGARATLRILGTDFLAVDRPDLRARITPDLTLDLSPERLSLRGSVQIPSALLRPPDLPPGAVSVSADEVVLGEESERERALAVDARVRLLLGDDVRFDGFDLAARFAGELDIVFVTDRPLQMFGDIAVAEGGYRAYGQNLTVDRGVLIFQGPPENPALDLRAIRRIREHDVVVGIEIGGTPRELRSRVFSEPPMDDTDAMAFLLTGRPLSGASQADGNLIAGAAAAWGIEQAGMITQQLGSRLGLDEFALDTEEGLDRAALTIGRYLSPRLLLRYSMGLFEDSYQVMLRYQLTRSLSIETTTGLSGQGVDLIYRIER